MIYVFSHDLTFSDELRGRAGENRALAFTEESRLAAAINESNPEAAIFDLRSGSRPIRLLEKTYFEKPSIIILAVLSNIGISEELFADREFYWPVNSEIIIETVDDLTEKRKLLKSCGMVGRSEELVRAAEVVQKVSPSDVNVLITGPSGAGKEVVARAIHTGSNRSERPFIAINVAAMAPGIIESELFGHERGAFTGATSRRIGAFEQASGGVIFLDEIAEIPPEIQAKLLRVLEQKSFTRVGGNVRISADFRLLAATNKVLQNEISAGRFREDLYFRLSVVTIDLPPLSQRKSDIAPLAYHFLSRRKKELKADDLALEPGAIRLFHRYDWPGNVRELKNVIDSFSVTSPSGRIRASDFERYVQERQSKSGLLPVITGRSPEAAEHQVLMTAILALTGEVSSLRRLIETELERMRSSNGGFPGSATPDMGSARIEDAERELIIRALDEADGNRKKAAGILGIGERTLYRKLDKYGLK